jgi:hypothetical protein
MAREDKTRPVDRAHAETRLNDARAFLQQADISLQFVDGPRRNATVVSSAVLAGIAACDAACALALGMSLPVRTTRRSGCSLESAAAPELLATCPNW